jgi:uncharacterized membrane protein YdjX (TVP38/TMEM64 family)
MSESFLSKVGPLYKKHSRLCHVAIGLVTLYILLNCIGFFYEPLSPRVLMSKESANRIKQYILSFDSAAPGVFILVQVLQVVMVPIPGQVIGFIGGFVFGWKLGALYTMFGLTVGMVIVFSLSRKLGRRFVEKLNGADAVRDFEAAFRGGQTGSSGLYGRSSDALRSHGLLTFFLIMLLPGLPDNLACFVAGLSRIQIWKLTVAAVVGRFPAMLMLAFFGDGWSNAENSLTLYLLAGAAFAVTLLYLWKKQKIESFVRKVVGFSGAPARD